VKGVSQDPNDSNHLQGALRAPTSNHT